MAKYFTLLRSRTFLSGLLLFLVAGFDGIRHLIPGDHYTVIAGLLALAVGYFRVNRNANIE